MIVLGCVMVVVCCDVVRRRSLGWSGAVVWRMVGDRLMVEVLRFRRR